MKRLTLLPIALLTSIACAQNYDFASFVQAHRSYGCLTASMGDQFVKGKLSFKSVALIGANVTDPRGIFGCAEIASYDLGKGWAVFAGPGIAVPMSDLSPQSFRWDKVGLTIGISCPLNLKF